MKRHNILIFLILFICIVSSSLALHYAIKARETNKLLNKTESILNEVDYRTVVGVEQLILYYLQNQNQLKSALEEINSTRKSILVDSSTKIVPGKNTLTFTRDGYYVDNVNNAGIYKTILDAAADELTLKCVSLEKYNSFSISIDISKNNSITLTVSPEYLRNLHKSNLINSSPNKNSSSKSSASSMSN